MIQSTIQLPLAQAPLGDKLASDTLTNANGDIVKREWNRDPPVNPQAPVYNAALLAGGASVNHDTPVIPSGKTGFVWEWTVSSALPCSWTLQRIDSTGTVHSIVTIMTNGFAPDTIRPPHREFTAQAGDNTHTKFRLIATNIDQANGNQVYDTAYIDYE